MVQWSGGNQRQGRPSPLRGVLEAIQAKAQPWIDRQPEFARASYGSVVRSGSEMLPGVGDLVGLEDLEAATRSGDAVGMGLGLLGAIPGIPAVGGAARRGGRAARRGLGLMADSADSAPVGLMGQSDADAALARYQAANPNDTGARVLVPGDEGYPNNAQWDEASQAYVAPVAEPDYPIRAYHGSPHSFDRFSLDAIGTGEGAQAYGHGLYFAESEDVARSYRDDLSQRVGAEFRFADGTTFAPDPDQAIALEGSLKDGNTYGWTNWTLNELSDPKVAEIDRLLRERGPPVERVSNNPGSMYEVGIDADPNAFIDYDAPLSQQPEHIRRLLGWQETPAVPPPADRELSDIIQRALKQAEGDASQVGLMVDNDGELYQRALAHAQRNGVDIEDAGSYVEESARDYLESLLPNEVMGDDLMALYRGREQELYQQGVPGVRYRDLMSRSDGADPTHNYVLFSDELVKVLRKYGISGLGLGLGAGAYAGQGQNQGSGL